jgi:hypothetical protein
VSIRAFISYAHADAMALQHLHKHLAVLRREGNIQAWTDHEIIPGAKFGDDIHENLEKCALFLALVSPDYLDSHYCYEKEFARALELMEAGRMQIVPIILEECEWRRSKFGQFLALPKDGKAVASFTNQNNAFLDVVTGIRRVLESKTIAEEAAPKSPEQAAIRSGRRPLIKQDFDAIQKSEFADKSFDVIRNYFAESCIELTEALGGNIKARYELMSQTAFTCTVVNRSKSRGGERHITVQNGKQRGPLGDINYVYQRYATDGSSNGGIRVQADDHNLFLTMDTLSYASKKATKLSAEQAAEALWVDFVKQVGVEYE